MICGALQTLNEEACEDVLEETEETVDVPVDADIPQTSVIPPSPETVQGESQNGSNSFKSCMVSSSADRDKRSKKVTYVDSSRSSYVEPIITILEPQSTSVGDMQSVKYSEKAFGDGDTR